MKLVKARIKRREDFPPVEFCCEEVLGMMEEAFGLPLSIDLDDQGTYEGITGHCGQQLGYKKSVRVIGSKYNSGYVPFDLLDIDESPIEAVLP